MLPATAPLAGLTFAVTLALAATSPSPAQGQAARPSKASGSSQSEVLISRSNQAGSATSRSGSANATPEARGARALQGALQAPPESRNVKSIVDFASAKALRDFASNPGGASFRAGAPPVVAKTVKLPPKPGFGDERYAYVIEFSAAVTGTGFKERAMVYEPSPPPAGPVPMLVVFHKFGSSHLDVEQNTTYLEEASKRGWYVVCPLGAEKMSFASLESQGNIELVLDFMMGLGQVDPARIYGVGFSMGGGAVTSYAARHLDPNRPMIAALIDHSGGVALNHTYFSDPPAQFIFDFWFGDGSAGSADPWKMNRSSVIDFDPTTLLVDDSQDFARNLLHAPMRIVRASNDPLAYLSTQSDVFDTHMKALGVVSGTAYGYYILPFQGHDWSMLDESGACDWLSQFTLQIPQSGRTLADRDGNWFHFDVQQGMAGQFTPFDWSADGATNSLSLTHTSNLQAITVDLLAMGLDPSMTLDISLSTDDGIGDTVRLRDVPSAPLVVLRDSIPETNWNWSAGTGVLTLTEVDGGAHDWRVILP